MKHQATLTKEAAREALRHIVIREMDALVAAQISNAKGINYLVVRQRSTGKFLRRVGASDPETHDPDTEILEVWEKDPSTPAFTDLMNRALDKPKEQEQTLNILGTVNIVTILRARHSRQISEKPNESLTLSQAQ
jgi:hypothetical protein